MSFQESKNAKSWELDENEVVEGSHGDSKVGGAVFNMTKTIVGAGIFGLPLAYQKAGFVTVTILVVVLAAIIHWTVITLLKAGLRAQKHTYHELMKHCFGLVGTYCYALFAFFVSFGSMAAYTIILGDTLPIVTRAMFGVARDTVELGQFAKVATDRRVIIILSSFLIMLPISSVRDVSKLAKFSFGAMMGLFVIAVLIIVAGIHADPSLRGSNDQLFSIFKPNGILSAVGTLCFAYVCHHNTFIIFRSLKKSNLKNFKMVNTYSLGIAAIMSLFVGISGYFIFSEKVYSNVLNGFSNTDLVANICRALFAVDMIMTYPLELFVCRNTIFKVIYKEQPAPYWMHLLMSIILVSATALIGVFTCDLGAAFDLTGGFAASAIAFIFPAACTIQLNGGGLVARKNLMYTACAALGLAILVLTSWQTLSQAIMHHSSSECKFITL